jgi:DNA-binding GntR family transcriptional regulator
MSAKSAARQLKEKRRARREVRGPDRAEPAPRSSVELDFQPRYARVAQSLIEAIAAGKYPVGTMIPTEAELCASLGVSRNTIRTALGVLSDMGLVTRHAGIGTVVRSLSASPRYVQEAETLSSLFPNIEATEQQTLSEREVTADDALAKLLDCRKGEAWLQIESLRSIRQHKLPVAYSHLYVPAHMGYLAGKFDRLRAPAYSVIDKYSEFRVAKLFQETSAAPVTRQQARRLNVEPGSAGMQILRRYFAIDGQVVLVSNTIYPAGRYSFSIAMKLPRGT